MSPRNDVEQEALLAEPMGHDDLDGFETSIGAAKGPTCGRPQGEVDRLLSLLDEIAERKAGRA